MIDKTQRDEGVLATSGETPELTQALIDRVHRLVDAEIPDHAIERAKHVVLDWMTATSAARETKEIQAMRSALLPVAGTGPCSVVGTSISADAFTAAIINGTSAHMLEIDDTLALMHGHPSGVVAAVLALAQQQGSTGREVLTAIVAGYEAAVYLGLAIGKRQHESGFEGTGIIGTVAATVACSVLLGSDQVDLEAAIGIATSTQAAGLRSVTGTTTKSLLTGTGGQRGLVAALLARDGFGGPARSLEHPYGLAAAISNHTTSWLALPEIDEDRYGIERTVFKFHSACHALHSLIESIEVMTDGRPLDPGDIDSVRIALAPRALEFADVKEPTTTLQARFSACHVASAYLTGLPDGASPIGPEALANEELSRLRRRVQVVGDEALRVPDAFTGLDLLSHVKVTKSDGSTLKVSVPAHGVVPPDRLSDQWRRLAEKAAAFAPASVGDDWATHLLDTVASLDSADDVAVLTALLT
jgi:2-methylcitrate dehydratase PrpD